MAGLTPQLVLDDAQRYGGMDCASQLAERHGVSPGEVHELLDRMETAGLIESAYMLDDERTIVHVAMRNEWFDGRRSSSYSTATDPG